jgi:hypothetical protein
LELRATYRTECLEETADSMSPYDHLVLVPRAGGKARAAAGSPSGSGKPQRQHESSGYSVKSSTDSVNPVRTTA